MSGSERKVLSRSKLGFPAQDYNVTMPLCINVEGKRKIRDDEFLILIRSVKPQPDGVTMNVSRKKLSGCGGN